MMRNDNLIANKQGFVGPTFSFTNRSRRFLWQIVWLVAARWTPPSLHLWRIFLLRLFGARASWLAYVYPSVEVWAPWNLTIEDYGTLARNVTCYNIASIEVKSRAVVSQGAHLCTGTHDYRDPNFPLTARPISIGKRAWICADTFVGPGVTVGDGAILSATGTTFRDLEAWTIYVGNPASRKQSRHPVAD
jgi:putative colanic acid biosynthesis acetyltransferase WcaF